MFQLTRPMWLPHSSAAAPANKGVARGYLNRVFGLTLLAMSIVVQGCGGGGGSSTPSASPNGLSEPEPGKLSIGITDAEGDFLQYSVNVESLTLTARNGNIVETLPASTRIDFTELTEVTEFLSIASVPAGVYETASIRIDFTSADIVVQDADGNAQSALPIDENGAPLTVVDLQINLTTSDVIRIAAGIPAAFSLDFDLDASNEVDFSSSPIEVTVEPFMLATPQLEADRQHRVRGIVDSVDTEAAAINLQVRPFRHRTSNFGEFRLNVNDDTRYDVDGLGYIGAEGLQAIADLGANSPLVASGNIAQGEMSAEIVVAGSSVPWSDADVVKGVVTARSDDVLTVGGARIEFADGREVFRGTFTVNLNEDTHVSVPGQDNTDMTIQSVSVGQRMIAWGEFTDDESITAERITLRMNQLTAEVVQAEPLAVELFFLNGRRPGIFNFAGTGATAEVDADPDFYEIDTALLPLAPVDQGELVRVRGLVNRFGSAPHDFLARTVIDVQTDSRAAALKVAWQEGSATPFSSVGGSRIDVELSEVRKALLVRGVPRDFLDELISIALIAPQSGLGVYAIKVRGAGEMHIYRNFDDLVDALVAQLDQGRLLARISSQGRYDTGNAEFTTRRAGFVFRADQVE